MFGLVVTAEAHPAFSGARTHSTNTAEMTAMIGALSFFLIFIALWLGMSSRAFITTLCMLLVLCLGTIQARTHVQLALACQRSVIFDQRKLRLTMQHVYGHNGNLGYEMC